LKSQKSPGKYPSLWHDHVQRLLQSVFNNLINFMISSQMCQEKKIMQKSPVIKTALPGPKARKLIEQDSTYVSLSYTRYYPLVVEKGRGLWVHDVDGNVFLDFTRG